MNPTLQRILFSIICALFLLGGYVKTIHAQELTSTTTWERSISAENLPDWFTTNNDRAAALVEEGENRYILVASAPAFSNDTQVRVLNADTGEDIGSLDLTDYPEVGTFQLSDVLVSEDNKIFLTNYGENQFNGFQVHLYDNTDDDTPELVLSDFDTVSDEGWGLARTVSISGNYEDGTATVYAVSDNDSNALARYTQTGPGETFDETPDIINLSEGVGSNPTASAFGAGASEFYQTGGGQPVRKYDSDGSLLGEIPEEIVGSGTTRAIFFNQNNDDDYVAIYSFSNANAQIVRVPDGDLTAAEVIGETPTLGDEGNANGTGSVDASVDSEGTFEVFVLTTNNGIGAYSLSEPDGPVAELPSNLFFSEYIEGSGNNKALEIYNATDSTIYLANYQIEQSSNGNGWEYYHEFSDGASIEAGSTYVLITDEVDSGLFAAEDADEVLGFPSPIHFNGNDARALIHINPATEDTTRLDVFGDPDDDTTWDVAGVSGAASGQTLLRKASVTEGNDTPLASFGTDEDDSEWIVNDEDDFSNLGEPTPEEVPTDPLAGDYYIPQGDNSQGFASLGEAVSVFNEVGLESSATFYISEDLDETGNVIKISRDDLSEMNSLTIKPAPGTSPTLTVSGNNSAEDENEGVGFLILNSDWITIDGSNEPDGDTRDLTITSSDDQIGGNGLISVYGGSANNVIKNTNITYSGSTEATTGIRARRNNADTGGIVNLLIENNTIGSESTPFGDGLRLWGSESNPNNTTALNNHIYSNHRGITTFWNVDNTYDGNSIWIVNPREDQGFYAGVYLVLTTGETVIQNNEFKSLAVNRTEDAAYAGGIVFNATLGPHTVTNNTFAIPAFENTGSATGNSGYGIVLNNAAGSSENLIYHNSFRISSSNDSGVLAAFGIEDVESTAQTWRFLNNIYKIEHNANNAYAYYWPAGQEFESDYNNFDIVESAAIAEFGDSRFDTLVDWNDLEADENSSEAVVEFVSGTDLRLTGSSIGDNDLAGFPIASVTTDIDGNTRSELAPYKGAFEGDVELSGDVEIGAFALLTPENGLDLQLNSGDEDTEVVITWEAPFSSEDVTYTWHADSLDGDFSEPLLSIPSNNSGEDNELTLTFQMIDSALNGLGVEEGETAELSWTVTAESENSVRFANEPFDISITRNLGVSNEITESPREFSLSQNYPNPFNPSSTIEFTLPTAADVRLDVYNISGQLVSTLVDSRMSAGQHSVVFDASNLASGVYLYRIRAGSFMQTKQMTLIK